MKLFATCKNSYSKTFLQVAQRFSTCAFPFSCKWSLNRWEGRVRLWQQKLTLPWLISPLLLFYKQDASYAYWKLGFEPTPLAFSTIFKRTTLKYLSTSIPFAFRVNKFFSKLKSHFYYFYLFISPFNYLSLSFCSSHLIIFNHCQFVKNMWVLCKNSKRWGEREEQWERVCVCVCVCLCVRDRSWNRETVCVWVCVR